MEKNRILWGEDLYKVFRDYIDEEGWLTEEWAQVIDNEIPELDSDYNTNKLYSETYGRMYRTDFEKSIDGLFIRPLTRKL